MPKNYLWLVQSALLNTDHLNAPLQGLTACITLEQAGIIIYQPNDGFLYKGIVAHFGESMLLEH